MKNFMQKKSLLKNLLTIASLGVFAAPVLALSLPALPTWSVQDGKLLDPNGNPFVFRGVTINHTLAPEKTVQALKDIAAMGANSAQIEFAIKLDNGYPRQVIAQLRDIIQTCKDSKLVCVLEANDASGYSQAPGSTSPSNIAYYWAISDMRTALEGAQEHIIIGFSNQIFDSNYDSGAYDVRMNTYLNELRGSLPWGYMVMIDGNKWGQDTDNAMLQFAQKRKAYGDSQSLIYSVDFFDAYTDPAKARDYIASFAQVGAPLVIGGFGPAPYYHPHNLVPRPTVPVMLPAQSIMQYAEEFGAGYFAWSWSGNENPALDMVTNWNPQALTAWGNLAINDVNGIKATAKPASIFSDSNSSSSNSSSSSSSANRNPVAVVEGSVVYERCENVYAKLSAEQSSDPDGDTLTYEWTMTSNFSSSVSYFSGPTLIYSGMRPVTNYLFTLTVSDGKGGTSTATKTLSHAYSDYCISSRSSSSSSIIRPSSSSVMTSSSSIPSSMSSSSIRPSSASSSSRSSSSSAATTAVCSYVVNSQWNNGFTAAIRIKNTSGQPINGWNVNWQYGDGSKIINLWNASLTGSNPYSAKNLSWNSTIQPGQTVEFGFQGSKAAGSASVPVVTGGVCQ